MREAELRDRFARHRSMAYVPDEVWDALREQITLTLNDLAAGEDEKDVVGGFLETADSYFRVYEAGARSARPSGSSRRGPASDGSGEAPGRTGQENHVPGAFATPAIQAQDFLDDYERRRAAAASLALASLAARMPQVQRFRRNILEREALTRDEAEAFVVSPATRFLTPFHFGGLGIPVLSHRARVVGWAADWIPVPRLEDLQSDPSVVYYELRDDRPWHYQCRVRVQFDPPGPCVETRIVVAEPEQVLDAPIQPQAAVDDWKSGDPFPVIFHNSVIDALRAWSVALAHQFPWSIPEAAWFILTGVHPQVQPLRLGSRTHHTIIAGDGISTARAKPHGETVITAEPWVSSKAVEAIYREVQRKRLGGDNRRLLDRNFEVFAFVLQNWPEGVGEPDWADLMILWNDHCLSGSFPTPGWRYKETWKFKRDFERAESKLLPGATSTMPHGPLASSLWYE